MISLAIIVNNLIYLLGGIGAGTIVSSLMINRYNRKAKIFDAKLLAYSALIEALQHCVSDTSEKAKQQYVAAQCKVAILVKNNEIDRLAEKFYNPEHESFCDLRKQLIKAMHNDLKI